MSVAPLFPQKPEKIVVPTGVSWKHNRDFQCFCLQGHTMFTADIKQLISCTFVYCLADRVMQPSTA